MFPTVRVNRVDYNLTTILPNIFDDLATALGADVDEDVMDGVVGAGVILGDPDVLTMARYVPSQFRIRRNRTVRSTKRRASPVRAPQKVRIVRVRVRAHRRR